MQVPLGQELLHVVDGHGLVDGAPGAGVLTPLVAHPAADGGEGIFPLDEGQCLVVPSLPGHLEIALNGHMGGAGGLAGGGAGFVGVDPGGVPIVLVPGVLAPADPVGQHGLGILHGLAILLAELLAQLQRACGAELHAAAAGHALFLVHPGGIGAFGHVGRVVQQAGPKGVADLHVAVADVEDMVRAVDVGDLVHVPVFLGLAQDIQGLLLGDVVGPARFHGVVRHVAHLDAPVLLVVGAAFAQHGP